MSEDKPAKLNVWGVGMLNKCTALVRNRIKREASKKRRLLDKKRIIE